MILEFLDNNLRRKDFERSRLARYKMWEFLLRKTDTII